MRRYRARRRDAGLRLERRWVPDRSATVYSDHRVLDLRSLALHGAIASKLRTRPELVEQARANLLRWRVNADERVLPVLEEWRRLLELPIAELAGIITDWSEEAIRLRQSSPFAGILKRSERKAIYEAFRP